jgi:hypothetical protein
MEAKSRSLGKSIVTQLDFGAKTAQRVTWEAWEFTLLGPYQVKVTNASYGCEKDDHAYVVGVEERDGVPVPAECECPADIHRDPDCKHKVALATIGGPTVLNAATVSESDRAAFRVSDNRSEASTPTATNGGVRTNQTGESPASAGAGEDEVRYTYHREPEHVGGARYVRCAECESESVPADPDRVLHLEGCSEGDR